MLQLKKQIRLGFSPQVVISAFSPKRVRGTPRLRFPFYRDTTRTKHIYHPAGLLFAFTIMHPRFLGVQDV